jgi:hypothetical protein
MTLGELLTPMELDFLWESSGQQGELRYPLRVRSHGATMDERAHLRRQSLSALAQRRLVDASGRPEPRLEEFFDVLAGPDLSLDTVQISAPNSSRCSRRPRRWANRVCWPCRTLVGCTCSR